VSRDQRVFTEAQLQEWDLPPDEPDDTDGLPGHVVSDEQVGDAKYGSQRRLVFVAPDDERTWEIEYELAHEAYRFDDGPDYGWIGGQVTGTMILLPGRVEGEGQR